MSPGGKTRYRRLGDNVECSALIDMPGGAVESVKQ
jgi:hypothetical protein